MNKIGGIDVKTTIFGAGYVGTGLAVALSELGNNVTLIDIDKEKIKKLKKGISPVKDEGIDEALLKQKDQMIFTTNGDEGIINGDLLMLAVGTPQGANDKLDISVIKKICDRVAEIIKPEYGKKYLVVKSTVPVGTGCEIKKRVFDILENRIKKGDLPIDTKPSDYIEYISNPEFLPEGQAYKNTMNPNRILIGAESDEGFEIMRKIYSNLVVPMIFTDVITAEYSKLVANTLLAMQVASINDLANLGSKIGVDFNDVKKVLEYDDRIGKFIHQGPGYGGYCFPKDVLESFKMGLEKGELYRMLLGLIDANEIHKKMPVTLLKEYQPDLDGKNITVWGLAFKKGSDNIKESPSINVLHELSNEGVLEIRAYDPKAEKAMRGVMKRNNPVEYFKDKINALQGSEALIIMLDEDEYCEIDLQDISDKLIGEKIIIDARGILRKKFSIKKIESYGLKYTGIGIPKRQRI